jgi:hypothetical protein
MYSPVINGLNAGENVQTIDSGKWEGIHERAAIHDWEVHVEERQNHLV